MKNRIFILSLLLGMQIISGEAQAEERKDGGGPERAAGTLWTEPKTGMEFVWIPSGCFQMGGDVEKSEQPVHMVCVKGFWMGRHEVTQAQYQQVMGNNPSRFLGANQPVDQVAWDDASNFTEEMSYTTGIKVRLPSEAEWEYACRAGGAHEKYCGGGGRPDRLGWYYDNSEKHTHPVGQLAANDWGLYDMSGNVWEWIQDCYNENYIGAPADGSAWKTGDCGKRMLRGGSWFNYQTNLSATYRNFNYAGNPVNVYGFRVARTLPQCNSGSALLDSSCD
jgi:formylglycine-generating enzyme required for sulfatase activity